ncbi:putative E3 ubiquitin-protein ligase makorin-1 [Apostichopus japonicus]|uniref:RING-type E3 ubiquitin transferase n=1 Tax=Stichopus japonicus TaxID=307972 RepID=A0A2G8LAB5_STIJA|nr:putative E3 ubiquitin-protein ligase makorin-1 [Apostichopus japonicus]
MATSNSGLAPRRNWQSQITCRYFIHGLCKAGKTCNYAHDRSNTEDKVCKYYKDGKCFYGENCKFSHESPASKPKPAKVVSKRTKLAPLRSSPTPPPSFKLTPLKAGGKTEPVQFPENEFSFETVIDVPEFIPGQPYKGSPNVPSSYSSAAKKSNPNAPEEETPNGTISSKDILCPFAIKGTCRYGDNCCYTHGKVCEFCNMACLHPFESEQNQQHKEECIKNHEVSMKESFDLQRSEAVSCSICMEIVLEKTNHKDQKFGILTNCTHAFCLECIRKWRSSKECEKKVVRACPVCRVPSNFVCPSEFWIEDKEEKQVLIDKYKDALSKKDCKYFNEGRGECPFGANCFYRHAYKDGTLQDRSKAVRRYGNANGRLTTHHPSASGTSWRSGKTGTATTTTSSSLGPAGMTLRTATTRTTCSTGICSGAATRRRRSVEDLMLGINMLGLTLVGAASSDSGTGARGAQESRGEHNDVSEQRRGSRRNDAARTPAEEAEVGARR